MQERKGFLYHRLNRRSLLKKGARAGFGLGLIAAGSIFFPGCSKENGSSEVDVVSAIKQFESQAGSELLTFDQAKSHLPLIAELFIRNTNSSKRVKDIVNDTFIVRKDFESSEEMNDAVKTVFGGKDEDIFSHPIIKQLKSDYPNLALSKELAIGLLYAMTIGDARSLVQKGRIFLVLDRINDRSSDKWQFQGSRLPISCNSISPAVSLRSTALHEMVHYDASTELQPLEGDFLEAYQEVELKYGIKRNKILSKGEKKNFVFVIDDSPNTYFNEFVTDYISATISIKNGLPYTLGYGYKHRPSDLTNFGQILKQVGIDENELLKMYKSSQLEMLMIKIAKAAKNVTFQNEKEMYAFSIRNFLLYTPIIWSDLAGVFPEVDAAVFEFTEPSSFTPSDPSGFLWYDKETGRSFFRETKLGCVG